jgi:thymidylate synthase (FAD)
MTRTDPKTYVISKPEDTGEMVRFLEESKVKWRPDPEVSWTENVMEFAGRLCYWSFEDEGGGFANKNLSKIREGNKSYLGNIIKSGHTSVLEHNGPLSILFSDVSRVFANELVRHRAGCSYSQTSGRYVRSDNIGFWHPSCVDTEAGAIMDETVTYIESQIKKLEQHYDIDNMTDFNKKKILTSAFRRIAPNGQSNNILLSCNHRAMRHMIELRTSVHAEEEIQLCFSSIAVEMKRYFPNIYQDMYQNDKGEWKFND